MNNQEKNVLIVSYYWPPAGGAGVQRWLKFVKYLPEFGWNPIVFVPKNPTYPVLDFSLNNDIPDCIQVVKHPIVEPYCLANFFSKKNKSIAKGHIQNKENQSWKDKISLLFRGNLFIPDARVLWVRSSAKRIRKMIEKKNIQAIITTGPPHSVHLIGMRVKKQCGIRWIADFRDPWTSISYHESLYLSKRSIRKHEQLELQILFSSDHIITTSKGDAKEFRKKTIQPISVITNGFEPIENNLYDLDDAFSIAHIGGLEMLRNPSILWKSLEKIYNKNPLFREKLRIKLIGEVSEGIIQELEKHNLLRNTKLFGYLHHSESRRHQFISQLLLISSFQSKQTRGIIPAKFFEYLNAKRPIIALGVDGSELQQIIEETQSGHFFTTEDEEKLISFLEASFGLYQNKNLYSEPINVDQFSRKKLTDSLAKLLDSI